MSGVVELRVQSVGHSLSFRSVSGGKFSCVVRDYFELTDSVEFSWWFGVGLNRDG